MTAKEKKFLHRSARQNSPPLHTILNDCRSECRFLCSASTQAPAASSMMILRWYFIVSLFNVQRNDGYSRSRVFLLMLMVLHIVMESPMGWMDGTAAKKLNASKQKKAQESRVTSNDG